MALDPRTPVIVGAGQLTRRPDDLETAAEPVDMMAEALRRAEADSGGRGLLQRAGSIRVVDLLSWRYAEVGRLLGERLGAGPRETVLTTTGGNSPQMLVNDTSLAVQRGDIDVALIVGAEAVYTRRRAREAGVRLAWTPLGEPVPQRVLGDARQGSNDVEMARALTLPTQIYPVFESAVRAAAGESVAEHQAAISALWSRFSEVASRNPYAWTPSALTAEQVGTVTPANRMVGFPYTKVMNANIDTDQAAGLVLCSAEAARSAGVPEDRWVFPQSGADAHDHWWVSSRADLHSSPAVRLAGRAALSLAGTTADDLAHVDLYSCFPSAVQMGAGAIGLGLDRDLTVTGGLSFAGGPGSNYTSHAIAAMVDRLRGDPGSMGLVTALGWYATKHAVGVYSTTPPPNGFRWRSPQDEVDALPARDFVGDHNGQVTVEAYTVMHQRDGQPSLGIVAGLLDDGRRTWANVHDPGLLATMVSDDPNGTRAAVAEGELRLG